MIYKEINRYELVILYALQQKLNQGKQYPSLTFSEIWKTCSQAAPNLMFKDDPDKHRQRFTANLFDAINHLIIEEKISAQTNLAGRIETITLTTTGNKYLTDIIFTHQYRLKAV